MQLPGSALEEHDERGHALTDDNFALLLNAHHEEIPFILPPTDEGAQWRVLIDTFYEVGQESGQAFESGQAYPLRGRSLVLLVETSEFSGDT